MKNLNRWLVPPVIAVIVTLVGWEVGSVDVNKAHFWELHDSLSLRLSTLILAIVHIYLYRFVAEKMIQYFTKGSTKRLTLKESLAIILVDGVWIIAGAWVGNHLPGENESLWIMLTRNLGMGMPVLLVYYAILRNSWITEAYHRQALQLEKTRSNQLETELKYLKAQYHPHFLFNALNTVYFQIDDPNADARNTVELLSELLRYQLYNVEEKVNIYEEINFVKTYIRFQQLRMTKRLTMNLFIDESLNNQKIYPLIYQPFLENAFKYVGGDYRINLEMKLFDEQIIFRLENSLPEQVQQTKNLNSGIGIENIKRRLALLYPDRHQLNIAQNEKSFGVELIIFCD